MEQMNETKRIVNEILEIFDSLDDEKKELFLAYLRRLACECEEDAV